MAEGGNEAKNGVCVCVYVWRDKSCGEVRERCGVEEKGREKRKRRQKRDETNRRKIFDIKIEGWAGVRKDCPRPM
jgi:hypothetical protein